MRDLCQHMMDLVENAAAAGATRVSVAVREDRSQDRLTLAVEDDGRGMSEQMVRQVSDPFCTTRTTRRVGLGLSLLRAAAERCGGSFTVQSEVGRGTRVECSFVLSHLDLPPLGNVVTTLGALIAVHPEMDLRYEHRAGDRCFRLDTAELRPALGIAVATPQAVATTAVRRWLEREWESFRSPAGCRQ